MEPGEESARLRQMRELASVFEAKGDHEAAARTLLELGDALCFMRNYDAGLPVLDEAREEARQAGVHELRERVDDVRAIRWREAVGP